MRVLIAEDEAVTRAILQRTVEKFGHEVLVAGDGEEALKLYRETPEVDVVISDWMMPGVDGLEFCRRLREEKRDGYTYFIFLTTLSDKAHLLEGLQAGADDYLTKPLDRDELQARLVAASRVTSLHRKLREQARRLSELASLRADFTAMVAHEIGSPLAAIRGSLDMLATGELELAEQDEVFGKIRTETDRLSTLVADVGNAAAVESGDFTLMLRPTSIGELLEDAAWFAETLPGEHPLVVEAKTEEWVRADRHRIGQVLRNLLSNAAKHSPDGAQIELRVIPGEAPGHVRIEVADHGYGVHPDDAERIFGKFGRGRDLAGRKTYGIGLGLYLSRRIVRAHGGELTLDPASEDGSVFGFELEIAHDSRSAR
jgi:signal transduction histidine kinase